MILRVLRQIVDVNLTSFQEHPNASYEASTSSSLSDPTFSENQENNPNNNNNIKTQSNSKKKFKKLAIIRKFSEVLRAEKLTLRDRLKWKKLWFHYFVFFFYLLYTLGVFEYMYLYICV